MKMTGRFATIIISIIYTAFQMIVFNNSSQKDLLVFLLASLILFFLGWKYDQTKLDRKQRKEQEESYKQLVELLPEALVIHTAEEILYANQAAAAMLGAKQKKELIGQSVFSFIVSDYKNMPKSHIERVYKEELPAQNSEKNVKRLDGKVITCEISSLSLFFEGKEAILSIVKDITGQRDQTARLLEKSEKLALVGQLAAGIAHEIRNPLTSLKGFIQLSRMDTEHKEEYFDIMLMELNRINQIVSELLGVAKPIDVVFKKQDVTRLLLDVIALINSQAMMDNVLISTEIEQEVPAVFGEENQLKQVFINLLKNAIEAMPGGGHIDVQMQRKENCIALSFKDQGVGIPEDRLPKLGDPFYTTKEKGTGLGLMTCCKIIENHGGELNIFSKVGEGTTVEVILPAENLLIKQEII